MTSPRTGLTQRVFRRGDCAPTAGVDQKVGAILVDGSLEGPYERECKPRVKLVPACSCSDFRNRSDFAVGSAGRFHDDQVGLISSIWAPRLRRRLFSELTRAFPGFFPTHADVGRPDAFRFFHEPRWIRLSPAWTRGLQPRRRLAVPCYRRKTRGRSRAGAWHSERTHVALLGHCGYPGVQQVAARLAPIPSHRARQCRTPETTPHGPRCGMRTRRSRRSLGRSRPRRPLREVTRPERLRSLGPGWRGFEPAGEASSEFEHRPNRLFSSFRGSAWLTCSSLHPVNT